jgi:hypothetical protein
VELLDDRGLLEALAEAGHHACLLRTAGGVQIVPPLPD